MEEQVKQESATLQEAVEQSKVVEAPKQEIKKEQPLTQIIHKDAIFELSLNDFSIMQQALAPLVWCNTMLNQARDRVMANPSNLVPVYENEGIWNRNEKGEIVGLKEFKNAEEFWNKHQKLKNNAMKIENGELKTN